MRIYQDDEGNIIILYSKNEKPKSVTIAQDRGTGRVKKSNLPRHYDNHPYTVINGEVVMTGVAPRFAFRRATLWMNEDNATWQRESFPINKDHECILERKNAKPTSRSKRIQTLIERDTAKEIEMKPAEGKPPGYAWYTFTCPVCGGDNFQSFCPRCGQRVKMRGKK